MRLWVQLKVLGCVSGAWMLLTEMACSRTPPETFGVTLDYEGVRYEGKLSFPDYDPTTHTCTTTSHGKCIAGSSISGKVEGDLPITSAALDLRSVSDKSYIIHVTHDDADQAVDRAASPGDAAALPYAVCVVTDDQVGHAVACTHSTRPCSITLVPGP